MRIYQRRCVWYIDYSFNGRRVRKKVGTSKKMAELALKETELKIVKKKFLGINEPKRMIFDKLCDEYLQFSKANKRPRSHIRDITSIKSLKQSFSNMLITEIAAQNLEVHKNRRHDEVKPATINREISCVKHMFTKAIEWGYLTGNPFQSVKKFKEPPGRLRHLSEEEIQSLVNHCNGQTRHIVIIALNTGMRRGEILNLTWGDINMKQRFINVRESKNNEIRTIPINDMLYKSLQEIGPQMPLQYVFTNDNGKPLSTIKTGFRAALKRAGITDFRFHDLRHTFASLLVMAGADIRTIQELLGHKDIKMTMRYSHLSTAHLRDTVNKLNVGTNLAQELYRKSAVLAKH